MENLTAALQQTDLETEEQAIVHDTIDNLPEELLVKILRNLNVTSLKDARLACRRWREAGAHSLFRRIYFAPRKRIMDVFDHITAVPAFASSVTELVYDARMFWEYMEQDVIYAKSYDKGFPDREPDRDLEVDDDFDIEELSIESYHTIACHTMKDMKKIEHSMQRYRAYILEQESIIDTRQDLKELCKGLSRLVNLKRISIVDQFVYQLDFSPFVQDQLFWYYTWSKADCKDMAPPSRWEEAAYTNYVQSLDQGSALHEYPWNFRGIKHLLEAIDLHAPRLRELLIGCQNSLLSAEVYSKADYFPIVSRIVPQLDILKVDCKISEQTSVLSATQTMTSILQRARNVQQLYFTLSNLIKPAGLDWMPVLQQQKWDHLRVLDLGDGKIDCSTLEHIGVAHFDMLRELRLRNIELQNRSWEESAAALAPHFRLYFLCFSSMSDGMCREGFGFAQSLNQRLQAAASHFMQWIPTVDVSFVSDGKGRVRTWHKQMYVAKYEGELDNFKPENYHMLDGYDTEEDYYWDS